MGARGNIARPTRELEDQLREIRVRVFWDERDPDVVRLATYVRRPDQRASAAIPASRYSRSRSR
jgi:hypothetical protein